MLALILLACGICVGLRLRVGWIPNDEGTLAQGALRVYQGQLPHRDFAEVYTGGLSILLAVAFRFFGVNLFSLRITGFLVFLAWLPVVYWIARRFVSPLWAGVVTLTAVSWSYPNYLAPMPSWFNLFFATFGAAAFLRYLDARTKRWIFLAGLCGGCSVLIKIIGLYYIMAVVLFLLFLEQSHREEVQPGKGDKLFRFGCSAMLLLYLAVLGHVVRPQLHDGEAYHFLLPSTTCVALLLWRYWHPPLTKVGGDSSFQRYAAMPGLLLPFAAGVFTVCGIYLVPYALSGSVMRLFHGVFGSTALRMTGLSGKTHAPGAPYLIYGLVTIGFILIAMYARWSRTWKAKAIVVAILTAIFICSALPDGLQDTWMMAGMLTPLAVLFGVAMILRAKQEGIDPLSQQRVMLLVCLAAVCSLVQYPFPYVTYFCYTAPFTLLAVVAAVSIKQEVPGKPILGVLLVFFLGMGMFCIVAKHVYDPEMDRNALASLPMPRAGGLRVNVHHPGYEELIPFLQAHASNGTMYAGNDCPEMYFLSGLNNPTHDDTGAPAKDVIAALHSGTLRLVVFNDRTAFASSSISPALRAEVSSVLPNMAHIGRFSVYWR